MLGTDDPARDIMARALEMIGGADLAEELRLPINDRSNADRCLVVVQSGRVAV